MSSVAFPLRRVLFRVSVALAVSLPPFWGVATATLVPAWENPVTVSSGALLVQDMEIRADGAGGAIVAWHDTWDADLVYWMRVSPSGTVVWGPSAAAVTPYAGVPEIDLVVAGEYFYVCWLGCVPPEYDADRVLVVKGKVSTGELVWEAYPQGYPVASAAEGAVRLFDACADSSGDLVVVFELEGLDFNHIIASKLTGNGATPSEPWGPGGFAVLYAEPGGAFWYPRVVSDGNGGVVAAWLRAVDYRDRLYVQRLDAQGNPVWSAGGVYVAGADAEGGAQKPRLAATFDGGAVVSWFQYDTACSCTALHVKKLAALEPLSGWGPVSAKRDADANSDISPPVLFDKEPYEPSLVHPYPVHREDGWGDSLAVIRLSLGDGSVSWHQINVTHFDMEASFLRAASDGMEGCVLVWSEAFGDRGELEYTVHALRVRGDTGLPDGQPIQLQGDAWASSRWVDVCDAGAGVAYATWNSGSKVYVQKLISPYPECSNSGPLEFDPLTTCTEDDMDLTVRNPGDETMPLRVQWMSGSSSAFSLPGPVPNEVAPRDSVQIKVHFAPDVTGPHMAQLHLTYGCEATVEGFAYEPACEVSPATLDFDSVIVGEPRADTLSFAILNASPGRMDGTVTLSGGSSLFSVVGGDTIPYSLAPEESASIEVALSYDGTGSQACGDFAAIIDAGPSCGCSSVQARVTVTDYGELSGLPVELDFGEKAVLADPEGDSSYVQTFTLHNVTDESCGPWGGQIWLSGVPDPPQAGLPPVFWLSHACSGTDTIVIDPGQACSMTVGFRPYEDLWYSAEMMVQDLGTGEQVSIPLRGEGTYGGPACAFCESQGSVPDTLDMGTLVLGDHQSATFCITNTGGGTLSGAVSLQGSETDTLQFSISPRTYSLGHGEERELTITYSPQVTGDHCCRVLWGSACEGLGSLVVRGSGISPGACSMSPDTLDFGEVVAGAASTCTLFVSNSGDLPISASIALERLEELNLEYAGTSECVRQEGDSLKIEVDGHGTCDVVFSFEPEEIEGGQDVAGWLPVHGDCGGQEVYCTGHSVNPGVCVVNANHPGPYHPGTQELNFDTLLVGQPDTLAVGLYNAGLSPCLHVAGNISLSSTSGFGLVGGGGPFDLECGDTLVAFVSFVSDSEGTYTATLRTGCEDVLCKAVVAHPQQGPCAFCDSVSTSPDTLDLGAVLVGGEERKEICLTNLGWPTIEGEARILPLEGQEADTAWFSLESATYSIEHGGQHYLVVVYTPGSLGRHLVVLDWGGGCGNLAASVLLGTCKASEQCEVSPGAVEFSGNIYYRPKAPEQPEMFKYVTVRNGGPDVLEGEVSLEDETGAFRLEGPGQGMPSWPRFVLRQPGESFRFAVLFRPLGAGSYSARILFGQGCPCGAIGVSAEALHAGDLSGPDGEANGKLDVYDFQRLLRILEEADSLLPAEEDLGLGDLNGDHAVDIADLVALAEALLESGFLQAGLGLSNVATLRLQGGPSGWASLLLEPDDAAVELLALELPMALVRQEAPPTFVATEGLRHWEVVSAGRLRVLLVPGKLGSGVSGRLGMLDVPVDAGAFCGATLGVALAGGAVGRVTGQCGCAEAPAEVVVVPNPAFGEAAFMLSLPAGPWSLGVFDVQGRLLFERSGQAPAEGAMETVLWSLTDGPRGRWVPPGIYFVRLASGGQKRVARLSVVR